MNTPTARPRVRHARVLLAALLCLAPLAAQESLPSPDDFLGWKLGDRFTSHDRIVAYAREAARLSERVTLTHYATTPEMRPLLYLVITSEENQARLQDIRERMEEVADPRAVAEDEDIEEIIADLPVTVWLSYNVHGNEASGSEAALRLIHRLTTAEDEQTQRWLREAVVIVDPCLNPDGRERFVSWFNGMRGRRSDPEPQSMEHHEPWPGGRTNHYQFDLNRDWAYATQVETRARLSHFNRWHPQVHVDFHEMGLESTYFFFPAEKPINANIPEHTLKWGKRFGRGNARAFDERGWAYYTAESYDLFYPGYGDSWPSFTGTIGMTYEQAGGGRAGALVRRRDRRLLSLAERLRHHEVASYSTIETAVAGRKELLGDYHRFRKTAIEEGRKGDTRMFLLPPGTDPGRADALVETLLAQGIEVRRTEATVTLERVQDSLGRTVLDRTFESGTYVVDLAQPLKRLAKTLLEPRTEIKELYFYDIAAWSLPLSFGVASFACPVKVPVSTSAVKRVAPREGDVGSPDAKVAWLLPYHTRGALEALVDLLERGVVVRSAHEPFTLAEHTYARGTLVIRRHENAEDLPGVLARVAQAHAVRFVPADTGFTDKGPDLGSGGVVEVVRPRIALCGGEGVGVTSFGATRFLLDRVLDVPYSVIPLDALARTDLDAFTVLVIPEARVASSVNDNLRRFVRDGGIVVAFGRAAFSLASGAKDAFCRVSPRGKDGAEKEKGAREEASPKWIEEKNELRRREQQPGSIFRVEIDPSHPLSFGYRAELAAFKEGTRSFDPSGPGTHVGLFKDAEPIAGYVNEKDARRLRGRAYLSVERMGRGSVVLFADDPNFRGAWRGLTRLFLNAVLLLPSRQVPPQVRRRHGG